MKNLIVALTLDDWVRDILADPLSKRPFVDSGGDVFEAPSGLTYGLGDGIPDFRVSITYGASAWSDGQREFEQWFAKYLDKGELDATFYSSEALNDGQVYSNMHLTGRVLDVGGGLGHVRKYLSDDQEFCSIDPFISSVKLAAGRTRLFATYPLTTPLNLLGGYAEFLPFVDGSFDSVNMRSVIDHFWSPELALLEAFRVLKRRGRLVVGVSVHLEDVSTVASPTVREERYRALANGTRRLMRGQVRHLARRAYEKAAQSLAVKRARRAAVRVHDHHAWRPTRDSLVTLADNCGFEPVDEYWQSSHIVYVGFERRDHQRIAVS